MMHLIKFVCSDSKVAPIEVQCSCGANLPAQNGINAMSIAREHIESERSRVARESAALTETQSGA